MKTLLVLSMATLGLSVLGSRGADGVTWLDDLGAATELAAETGKPLLVVFR